MAYAPRVCACVNGCHPERGRTPESKDPCGVRIIHAARRYFGSIRCFAHAPARVLRARAQEERIPSLSEVGGGKPGGHLYQNGESPASAGETKLRRPLPEIYTLGVSLLPCSRRFALLVLALVGTACAQSDHPVLTGTWKLNRSLSETGKMRNSDPNICKIKHTGTRLEVLRASGPRNDWFNYILDGKLRSQLWTDGISKPQPIGMATLSLLRAGRVFQRAWRDGCPDIRFLLTASC